MLALAEEPVVPAVQGIDIRKTTPLIVIIVNTPNSWGSESSRLPQHYQRVPAMVSGLSVALKERDDATQEHCDRVSAFCLELGRACGLTEVELAILRLAAGLHDIGKIGIPDHVLKKPGLFDEQDRAIMETHATRGERIVLACGLAHGEVVGSAVRHHHERFDGRGYPDGVNGESIPIMARMISLVDAYDAMARLRPHGVRRSHVAIMRELLQEDGGQHDPYLIRKFAALIDGSVFKAEN